jgi:hypothetical protein
MKHRRICRECERRFETERAFICSDECRRKRHDRRVKAWREAHREKERRYQAEWHARRRLDDEYRNRERAQQRDYHNRRRS